MVRIEDGVRNVINHTTVKKFSNFFVMNSNSLCVLIILSVGTLCLSFTDIEAREIGRMDPLSAHVNDSFQCNEVVEIMIKGPNRSYLSKENKRFQQLVSTTGMTMGFECPKITTLKVVGMAGGSPVFEGYSKKDKRWLLVQGKLKIKKTVTQKQVPRTRKKTRIGFPTTIKGNVFQHDKKVGPFSVSLRHGVVTPEGKPVLPMVSLPKKLTISLWPSTWLPCAGLMTLDIKVWPKAFNYEQFLKNKKGTDLPPPVIDALYLMLDLLSEQCDVKALRFRFSALYSGEDNLQYIGTISSDRGWVIQDGIVQTPYDQMRKVTLRIKDPYYPAGIFYKGNCETNPILPLKQVYKTNPFKAWPEDIHIKMSDYTFMGKKVAEVYLAECPGTETISFTIDPVPEDYICKDEPPCYLTWSKQNPKEVISPYKYQEKPMLTDYNDVMNAFIEGNYELLDEYKGYVRFFHNDFLEIYSDFCSNYMTDRVAVDIKSIETRYNSDGFVESQKQIGETYRVYIDPRYSDRFESFRGPNHAWATAKMMRIISNKTSIHATNRAIGRAIDVFIGDRNMIKNFLNKNKCKGAKSQIVYENLDRYFRQMPPKRL